MYRYYKVTPAAKSEIDAQSKYTTRSLPAGLLCATAGHDVGLLQEETAAVVCVGLLAAARGEAAPSGACYIHSSRSQQSMGQHTDRGAPHASGIAEQYSMHVKAPHKFEIHICMCRCARSGNIIHGGAAGRQRGNGPTTSLRAQLDFRSSLQLQLPGPSPHL